MPKTEKTQAGVQSGEEAGKSLLEQDEELAAMVSAYLDGELEGQALADFKALRRANEALSREIAVLERINSGLKDIGAGILNEPVPEALLAPLSRLPGSRTKSG
jgi:anti-sigma factor RsiW